MKYLVTNAEGTKGAIVESCNCDEARKIATDNFYSPFARKKDLNVIQVYEENKHLFVSVNGNKKFGFVQFHTMGGVSTSYNCSIDTKPTDEQLFFLGKEIVYTKFFLTEKERY